MDTQIDYASGVPVDLLDELPLPIDPTESFFLAPDELPEHGHNVTSYSIDAA